MKAAGVSLSKIEWTEKTWNPVVGCTEVSPGCDHCYAKPLARRLKAMRIPGYENGFELNLLPERLEEPLKRAKPTMYFVNSMSDLFQKDIPFSFIDSVFDTIKATPQHTYQILTKRSGRMVRYFKENELPHNAWLGVSVEDIKHGVPRIKHLSSIDAKTPFLSMEPLIEDIGTIDISSINWVIVGGESGHKARPMDPAWVFALRDHCLANQIPFFFKQWGTRGPDGVKRNKKINGRLLDGRLWDELPANYGQYSSYASNAKPSDHGNSTGSKHYKQGNA